MKSRRILVTGGAGFIGSHLVRRLVAEGHGVDVLHRPVGDLSRIEDLSAAIRCWPCDLLDVPRLNEVLEAARPEVLYHLAGDTSFRRVDSALSRVAESLEVNVRSSLNVFLAANSAPHPLALLVRLGGLEEYGSGPLPYRESQRERPISPYSASQVSVTHYLGMLAPHLKYRTVTLRPSLIYGPAQSREFLVPAVIEHCLAGRDFRVRSGDHGRDLLYVDDLIDALLSLLERIVPGGEIINVGAGREYRMSDVAAAIVRLTGARIRLREDPAQGAGLPHLYCSTEKARELLAWRPRIDLEDGLTRTIAWFRAARPVPS